MSAHFGEAIDMCRGARDEQTPPNVAELHAWRVADLIITNKGIKNCPELLADDEVLATAILDRPLHHRHVLNITRRSCSHRDLEQAVSLGQ